MSVQEQPLDALSTDHLKADLKGRSVRGGLLTLTSQGTQFLIQSVSTVVLARLLTPADFGLVAMVSAITVVASGFADLGLSEATIQRREITHDQVSTLFWINVAVGLALTLITAASAPLFARFYRDGRLVNVTLLLSLTFLIGGFRVQPDALLKRQMRFSSLAFRDITASALAVFVSIFMAWRGAGYFALLALPLTMYSVQMAFSWLMVKWRPSLPRRDAEVGSMVKFGGNVAASYLTINLNRSIDNVLVGWYWGATPLGLYSRAYNLLMLPVRQLSAPAGSVAIPAFSRLQNEPERFAQYYLRAVNLIMWIATPIFGFLFVAANPVIVLTLGNQWREAAPVFQILVISALGQLLLESTLWLFVSRGQPKRLLKLMLVISPIIVVSFVIGLPFGIKGVALSGSLVLIAIFPWILRFAFRGTTITLQLIGRALLYPMVTCLVAVCFGRLALRLIAPERIIPQLLVVALGFATAYLCSALIPAVREEVTSFGRILNDLRFPGRAAAPTAQ
ncbi:MAG: lipopolysaccharide biosynthesis protein [Candidatus Acidiferrales bacterium]